MSETVTGRKVRVLRLHSATHFTGLGNLGPLIDSNSKLKGDTSIVMVDGGAVVTYKGMDCFISNGNIISAELESTQIKK